MKKTYACVGLVLFLSFSGGCRFFEFPGTFENPYDPSRIYVYDRTVGETAYGEGTAGRLSAGGGFCRADSLSVSPDGSFCLMGDRGTRRFRFIRLDGSNATSFFHMENANEDPNCIWMLQDGRTAFALVNGSRLFRMDVSDLAGGMSGAPSNVALVYAPKDHHISTFVTDPDGSVWVLGRDNNAGGRNYRLKHLAGDGSDLGTIDSVLFSEEYNIGSIAVTRSAIVVVVTSDPKPELGRYGRCIFYLDKGTGNLRRQIYTENGTPVTLDSGFTADTSQSFHPASLSLRGDDGIAVSGWLDEYAVWTFDENGVRNGRFLLNSTVRDAGWSVAATDAQGTVYVAANRERSIIRSTDSVRLYASRNLRGGEFIGIDSVGSGSDGNVYLCDSQAGTIQRLDPDAGTFDIVFSSADRLSGNAWNMNVSLRGNDLFVSYYNTIDRLALDGTFRNTFAVLPRDVIFTCPLSDGTMLCILNDGMLVRLGSSGSAVGSQVQLPLLLGRQIMNDRISLCEAPDGAVWLAFMSPQGSREKGYFSFGRLAENFSRYEEIGTLARLPGRDSPNPWDDEIGNISVSSSGFVWLAFQNRRIVAKFASDGTLIGFLGGERGEIVAWNKVVEENGYDWRMENGKFSSPRKIVTDDEDTIYVSDSSQLEIFRVN